MNTDGFQAASMSAGPAWTILGMDVPKLRAGHYTDAYFMAAVDVLRAADRAPRVLMQVFQRNQTRVHGIDDALKLLAIGAGDWNENGEGWPLCEALEVRALPEGSPIAPFEPVLTIAGDYRLFAHLETPVLGLLARRTLVAHNTRALVEAAGGLPVLFMAARHDDPLLQESDGWAAIQGGAVGASTPAGVARAGSEPLGTMPHALIGAFGGDTVAAARAYSEAFPDRALIPLVDWDNDCVGTSLALWRALGDRLHGVRLDTSGTLVDASLAARPGTYSPTGVCPELVHAVRDALDAEGAGAVKIIVSGGFKADKVRAFVAAGVPVDGFGVGSSLLRGANDYTADIVRVDGRPCSKVGRSEVLSDRLVAVDLGEVAL